MNDVKIYQVTAISCEPKAEEILQHEFKIYKIRYNKPDLTMEDYVNYLKRWNNDKYSINGFISSYHLDEERAVSYVENNIGDINEAGVYDYAAVSAIVVDAAYYNSEQDIEKDITIYKYNHETDKYEKLTNAPELIHLKKYIWNFA